MGPSPEELASQKGEALQSLSDFNDGTWAGVARSFGITSDSAAGVTRRQTSPPYNASVSTRIGLGEEGLRLVETLAWEDGVATKQIALGRSADVDSVDGSYSADAALLDLPSALSGTDALTKFAIEQSIAVSDSGRVRCFLLYGMDDRLSRVVVCEENRVAEGSDGANAGAGEGSPEGDAGVGVGDGSVSPSTPPEERLEKLQRALSKSKTTTKPAGTDAEGASPNEKYPVDLYGLSLGVWLGDAVVRDYSTSPSPLARDGGTGKGFGAPRSPSRPKSGKKDKEFGDGFAEWSLGVQKITMEWKWDFGDAVRQVLVFGRSMGAETGALPLQHMGSVNDELNSRRIPKEQRMTYIDCDQGRYAAFLVGSTYIKAPRYLSFSEASSKKFPFYTEYISFQKKASGNDEVIALNMDNVDEEELPEAFCSRMTRLYDKYGELSQGSTQFFLLKKIA